jgi:hypothetical protein
MFQNGIRINGEIACEQGYIDYHAKRIRLTLEKLRRIGAKKILEIGSHPWAMTAALIDDSSFEVCATVSAEEIIKWPDDIDVRRAQYHIKTSQGKEVSFPNYSVNVERKLFDIKETPNLVLACEIIEHLHRSPHMMLLNANRWLPMGGKILLTTPNGAQFSNPLRRKSPTPAYRANIYERHSYVYTLNELVDLVTLCGFKIKEAGYWDAIERTGPSKIYSLLSKIPLKYFKDKFMKTIYLVGEKDENITELERCPKVYDARGQWEFIRR